MKKLKYITTLIILITVFSNSFCQRAIRSYKAFDEFYLSESLSECGTWIEDSTYLTSWEVIDTINFNPESDPAWIMSEWEVEYSEMTLLYCPCGCGYDTKRYMYRINKKGIRQIRYEIATYKYIPKPKSDYERLLDSLLKTN